MKCATCRYCQPISDWSRFGFVALLDWEVVDAVCRFRPPEAQKIPPAIQMDVDFCGEYKEK